MNAIQSYLQFAVERRAQEILVNPSQPIRARVGRDIVSLGPQQVTPGETRQMISQILNDEEKKMLFENLKIQGVRTIGSIAFKFSFQVDFEGVSGSLELQNSPWALWSVPPFVIDSLARPQGLNLIVGPRRSGKTSLVRNLIDSLSGRQKVVAVYSDSEGLELASSGNVISQFPMDHLRHGALRSADLVVIDSAGLGHCETALRLVEEGRSVLLTLPFWDLQMGLHRLLELCEGTEKSQARRLASVLQMGIGLKLVPGLENPLVGAFEILMGSLEVQRALAQKDFATVEKIMSSTGDKTGMRSMNQALFQLLIKRKIEMKTAFEYSPEPQELDLLLKKVGI